MKKEETFYEPFSPLESDGNESIFLNPEKSLKITITDGNYTLREGIDYGTVYVTWRRELEHAANARSFADFRFIVLDLRQQACVLFAENRLKSRAFAVGEF